MIGTIRPGVPCYVRSRELEALVATPGAWLRYWTHGGEITAAETPDHAIVRRTEPWDGQLADAVRFWRREGLPAVSSPGMLAMKGKPEWFRPGKWSLTGWASRWLRGAWQEARVRGVITGPHAVFDIRRAYRWALTAAPLPDRRTVRVAGRYATDRPGLHVVETRPNPKAPRYMREGGWHLLEVPDDLQYGSYVRGWKAGVTWTGTIDARPLADWLDTGPAVLQRAFWGPWIATEPTVCTWHTGTKCRFPPYGADPVRGHLILQRVRRRLAEIEAPYYYVDSVITADSLPVGDRIGDWRKVREFRNGVRIAYPGGYGPIGQPLEKHAGMQ